MFTKNSVIISLNLMHLHLEGDIPELRVIKPRHRDAGVTPSSKEGALKIRPEPCSQPPCLALPCLPGVPPTGD